MPQAPKSGIKRFLPSYGLLNSILLGLILAFLLALFNNQNNKFIGSLDIADLSFNKSYLKASPSIVSIYAVNSKNEENEISIASGIIMSNLGYILTSAHAVNNADQITVTSINNSYKATLIGLDNLTDLAVLKIEPTANNQLIPASFETTPSYNVGDLVLTIGNPYNLGKSVSVGVISGLGRSALHNPSYQNFIQTDAFMDQGSSGGALVNLHGNVIAINTVVIDNNNRDLGFALPITDAIYILNQIITTGKVTRSYFGITTSVIQVIGNTQLFATISNLDTNGPAYKAGLRAGDIIVAINGNPVKNPISAISDILYSTPGTAVQVNVDRQGQNYTFVVHPTEISD